MSEHVDDATLRAMLDDAEMDIETDPMELTLFPIGAFKVRSLCRELLELRAILRDVAALGDPDEWEDAWDNMDKQAEIYRRAVELVGDGKEGE